MHRGPRGRQIRGSLEHTAPLGRGSSGSPIVDGDGRELPWDGKAYGDLLWMDPGEPAAVQRTLAVVADVLRRSSKPVLLIVNKVDNQERALYATEFYALGFEKTFLLSSMSGSGTGEVLDEVVTYITEDVPVTELDKDGNPLPKFAIIGQPNAGKSTLLNALINQERTIVSEIAGTTRDTIHTHYNLFGKDFILIDTAGIRKKKNVHEDLEFYSVIRAIDRKSTRLNSSH